MTSTTYIPRFMKAWQFSSAKGGLEKNLAINEHAQVPKPGPDQILVKIKAVSLNPVDYKPSEVQLLHWLAISKPATPAADFAGTVVSAPAGSKFEVGQEVCGSASNPMAGGMLAEYVAMNTKNVAPLVKGVTHAEGASLGIAGLTAYGTILKHAKPNSRIFVNGGSGGVGTFAIQMAKIMGHEITVTCSGRNVELCQSLGAEVIDYTKGSVLEALIKSAETRKFDLVIDNIYKTPELYWKAHEYTNPGTPYLLTSAAPTWQCVSQLFKMYLIPSFLGGGRRKLVLHITSIEMTDLEIIENWCAEKKLRVVVDEVFPFDQARQAYEKIKTSRAVGKIIVDVEGSAGKKTI